MLYSIEQQMAEQDGKCNWYAGSDSNNINLYSCDIGLLDINDIGKYKTDGLLWFLEMLYARD